MKDEREFVGTLRGFDDYVNLVLEDVTALEPLGAGASTAGVPGAPQHRKTPLDSILLNGAGIAVLVPGSDGPEEGRDAAIGPTSG